MTSEPAGSLARAGCRSFPGGLRRGDRESPSSVFGSIPRSSLSETGLMSRWGKSACCLAAILAAVAGSMGSGQARPGGDPPPAPKVAAPHAAVEQFVERYCLECHDGGTSTAGLALDELDP